MEEPIFYGDYSFNTGKLKQFSAWDYVLFAAILVISAGIGFFHAWRDRNKKSLKDFLLAGKNMGPIPVGLSLLASFMSAITLLGTPAEMYNYTMIYWWIGLGYFLVIAGAAHLYIPIFYNLKVTSAYEYLEHRFSKGVRTAASCTFVLQMILYMAIVLYAPSLALNAVTGFTLWGSVVSVGIVCTIYTAFGGMKAVLWTDCFQVCMMVASLLAVLIKGGIIVGGIEPAWESARRTNRLLFDDFSPDPSVRHSVWSLVIGGYFTWVAIFGVNQAQVQRAITCSTLKDAKLAVWLNFPGLCLILYLCCFIGIFMSAFYEKCDPLKGEFVTDSNQLLPMFVMDILGDVTGLPGLFVAGLFSGALSTISSGLNSISAAILEDVIRAYFKKDLREDKARLYSQVLALVFGAICLGLTFVASQLGSVLQAALSLFGMIGGPLLGVFSLGMFFPWANKWGAFSGLISGLVLMFWIGVGAAVVKPPQVKALRFHTNCNLTSFNNATVALIMDNSTSPPPPERDPTYPLYTLSYLWYSATAVLTVIVIGLIVSFLTGPTKPSSLDPRLICPLCDHIFPFNLLPEAIRKPLRFGINHEGKNDKASNNDGSFDDVSVDPLNGKPKKDELEKPSSGYVTEEKGKKMYDVSNVSDKNQYDESERKESKDSGKVDTQL
ncbi:sodium-coupled monocarboxylate transporter 1 [Aplysia californica]|uniref:Sodium-coupled monocarboxylate transporter 1 n=1 Tax=Aplysia californica TaxID=6500 RepID=A0ABM0ZVV2_APLCA|nr:sodium-coupled monocarboxylate transporter 1 [Aplysia californica]XP_012935608.1 sodium-coupled monocarboxylate transporter 1 [Aplysia californica]XP_012935609.1 sodium-coupled monocarboxylate transporter 1 [Aplysia californica]XP_035824584.1 sodium-coupled monocarboxylate transporter 1 [Aplysia californica]